MLFVAGPVSAGDWLENIGLLVKVDGKPSGTAHIYDSDDYQRLLLVMEDKTESAILDLAATTVFSIPRDSVRAGEDGIANTGEAIEEYLALLDSEEGTLHFLWNEAPVTLEPLPPLIGPVDLETLLSMKPTYQVAAEKYSPEDSLLGTLKAIDVATEIRVYFGTWCHICKKMVPPMIGTLAKVGNPNLKATYIGVDEDLTEPADEIDRYIVSTTPTVLVLRDGMELGRIEEELTTTLEAALVEILETQ